MRSLEQRTGDRSARRASRALVGLCLAIAFAAAPGYAQRRPQAELEGALREQAQRERERDRYRAEAERVTRELAGLRDELARLAQEQARGQQIAGRQQTRLQQLNAQEAELNARLFASRSEFSRLLGALQAYGRSPPPALFVSPRSATDAARASILMRAMQPELDRRVRAYRAQAEAIRRVRREAAAASETLITTESRNAERRAQIETLIAQRAAVERRLYADAAAADMAVQTIAERAQSLRSLVDALPTPPSVRATGVPGLARPVAGDVVRRFGQATPGGRSEGVSYRASGGATVYAPASGRVQYAGEVRGAGIVLILTISGGYHVVLAGLESAAAGEGTLVTAGQPVGRMADRVDPAPELYMEVRRNGEPVDPARFIGFGSR